MIALPTLLTGGQVIIERGFEAAHVLDRMEQSLVVLGEIPRNATGKIRQDELRRRFA
ncbi:hypothetical protein [Nocardia carnea]|uniref:hypothetical protein n=1 Tax=Nocardia carnea TaxID=37328 RepID=UPI002454202B|nr:hypothetical protein [Nocardia carnea]